VKNKSIKDVIKRQHFLNEKSETVKGCERGRTNLGFGR
jgi:hypothetical protein